MYRVNDHVTLHKGAADKLPEDWKAKAYAVRLHGKIVMISLKGYHVSFNGDDEDPVLCAHRDFVR